MGSFANILSELKRRGKKTALNELFGKVTGITASITASEIFKSEDGQRYFNYLHKKIKPSLIISRFKSKLKNRKVLAVRRSEYLLFCHSNYKTSVKELKCTRYKR